MKILPGGGGGGGGGVGGGGVDIFWLTFCGGGGELY